MIRFFKRLFNIRGRVILRLVNDYRVHFLGIGSLFLGTIMGTVFGTTYFKKKSLEYMPNAIISTEARLFLIDDRLGIVNQQITLIKQKS